MTDRLDLADMQPVVQEHFADLNMSEAAVWNFHKWLRDEYDDLSPGYRRDLVKAAYTLLVLKRPVPAVANGSAAMKKLEEYAEEKGSTTGDADG